MCYHLQVESKKLKHIKNIRIQKWIDREQTSGCQWDERRRREEGKRQSIKRHKRGLCWRPVAKTSPSHAGGASSTPGEGAKVPCASQSKHQNKKQRQHSNSFHKDKKKMVHIKKYFKKYRLIQTK